MSINEKLFNDGTIQQIEAEKERWVKKTLKGNVGDKEYFTESGIPIDILYTPADLKDMNYQRDVGFPGENPFLRGVYPNMYRGRLFTVRQLAGFGAPEDCNKRIKFLLDNGATGVNIVFDLPTIRGYNSDDPAAEGNVGVCGVAIDSLEDMEALFDEVPIDKISSSVVFFC